MSATHSLTQIESGANPIMTHKTVDATASLIRADELAQGDIILYRGDIWQVLNEPQYTCSGIEFEVLWLDIDAPDNTQSVCFAPNYRFELIRYQPIQPLLPEPKEIKNPCFIHAQIHQGQLIGILEDETGFTFHIFSPTTVEQAEAYYDCLLAALSAAIKQVESDTRWQRGFWAYEQGKPLPEVADLDFIRGWHDGQQAYGRAA